MSNLLKVAMIDLVLSLHRQGLSQRRIASEVGINRETVARYLSQPRNAAIPANAPPARSKLRLMRNEIRVPLYMAPSTERIIGVSSIFDEN